MLSDAYMINVYFETARPGTANALLGMVGANLGWQVIVMYGATHSLKKDKWKTILLEFLSIVTFMKPGAAVRQSPPNPTPTP